VKRGGPLRRRRDARWARLRLQVLERDGHRCQFPRCGRPASDVHHIAPRSTSPHLKYDIENLVSLCRECHGWVGDRPTLAAALGLHRFSWDAPPGQEQTINQRSERSPQAGCGATAGTEAAPNGRRQGLCGTPGSVGADDEAEPRQVGRRVESGTPSPDSPPAHGGESCC
jgi:hypothetical protein